MLSRKNRQDTGSGRLARCSAASFNPPLSPLILEPALRGRARQAGPWIQGGTRAVNRAAAAEGARRGPALSIPAAPQQGLCVGCGEAWRECGHEVRRASSKARRNAGGCRFESRINLATPRSKFWRHSRMDASPASANLGDFQRPANCERRSRAVPRPPARRSHNLAAEKNMASSQTGLFQNRALVSSDGKIPR